MAVWEDDVDLDRDRDLVVRFQAGETEAFDELYQRYLLRITRFCRRRGMSSHEAEEIAQEAFLKAYRALPRLGGDLRFYPWLTVIAGRLCTDAHRRTSRHPAAALADHDTPVDGGQEQVFAAVDRALLAEAVDRLVPRHRQALDLRENRGWTYRQIAEHMNVSLGTVELLILRARRALKREFLAVAGPEGRLVALAPVLAWLRARLESARSRADLLLPAAGGAVASLAIAVGVTVSLLVPQAAAPAPSVASRPMDSAPSAATAPAPAAVAIAASAVTDKGRATEPIRPVAGVEIVDADEGRRRAAEQPVHLKVGPVTVGADPQAAVDQTAGTARAWLGQDK